jgi:hypothetical protein
MPTHPVKKPVVKSAQKDAQDAQLQAPGTEQKDR